jgi:hypothetical protein
MVVQSQPEQTVLETLSQKNSSHKRTGGLGPEFKPHYLKKKKKDEQMMLEKWIMAALTSHSEGKG